MRWLQKRAGVTQDGIFGPVTARALVNVVSELGSGNTVSKSPEYKFDPRTEKNLNTLTSGAQKKFRPFTAQAVAIAGSMGYVYKMISGSRTYAQQNALYAKGRSKPGPKVTNARGGQSNHNFGHAVDYGVFKGDKYMDSVDPKAAHKVHAAVAQAASKHGIEWGGNWRSFKDTPHFQVDTGLTTAQMRALVAKGKEVV